MIPNSRQNLIDWSMRRLGWPTIEINVDDDQVEDRVDEALQVYTEEHSDAADRFWLKHAMTQDDIDNGYITVPDYVFAVVRVLSVSNPANSSSDALFNLQYQVRLHSLFDLANTSVVQYDMTMSHLRMLDIMFAGEKGLEFTRHASKITLRTNLQAMAVGQIVVFECWRALDPEEFTKVYNDRWLKRYTTALLKFQWGNNLSKFDSITLPGGTTTRGGELYTEALEEMDKLEEELRTKWQQPPRFFIG